MNRFVISALAAASLLLGACDWAGIRGNGHVVTEQRPIGDFFEVRAEGSFDIEWGSGGPSLTIVGEENLLPYIANDVSGGVLRLRTTERIWSRRKLKVSLSSAALHGARLTGACRLTARQLSGQKFYVQSEGASRMLLDGQVDQLLADMSGATRLEAEALKTKTTELSGSGASHADVFATDALRVSISGAGKVAYAGNPKTVEKHISGAASVHKKE